MPTKIEWTEETWNPVIGCSPVSEGCRNCYAARYALRLANTPWNRSWKDLLYEGLATKARDGRPVFTGFVRCLEDRLDQPLRWKKPRMVFVGSMSDLFHPEVSSEFVDEVYDVMCRASQHTFQILTKRPGRMSAFFGTREPEGALIRPPLPNVWLGVSVENQSAADERIPLLLQTPAAVRFVSYEPALEPVDLRRVRLDSGPGISTYKNVLFCPSHGTTWHEFPNGATAPLYSNPGHINWVIVGGESGPRARPCNVEWIRSIVRQCRDAEVPVFVKQLGARPVGWCVGRLWGTDDESEYEPDHCDIYEASEGPYCKDRCQYLRHPKGGDPSEWPEDLRVREWPQFQMTERSS